MKDKAKRNQFLNTLPFFLMIFLLTYLFVSNLESKNNIVKPYYPENVSKINERIKDVYLLDFDDSIEILRKTESNYLLISETYTPSIDGFSLSYYKDEEKLKRYSKTESNNLYLFSRYRNNAIKSAEILRKFSDKKIYIIDYNKINIEHTINEKINKESIHLNFNNLASTLNHYNVISVVDNNAFKKKIPYKSYVLSTLDLKILSDSKINSLSNFIDKEKKTLIIFNFLLSENKMKAASSFLAKELKIKSLTYSDFTQQTHFFSQLSNDNKVTTASKNSNNVFNAPELLAFIKSSIKVDFYCYSEECMKKIPNFNEKINLKKIDVIDMISIKDGLINVDLNGFEKDTPIFLFLEDFSSSLFSDYLIKELNSNGYNFQGKVDGVESVFDFVYEENGKLFLNKDSFYIPSIISQYYYLLTNGQDIRIDTIHLTIYSLIIALLIISANLMYIYTAIFLYTIPFLFYRSITFSDELYNSVPIHSLYLITLCIIHLLLKFIKNKDLLLSYKLNTSIFLIALLCITSLYLFLPPPLLFITSYVFLTYLIVNLLKFNLKERNNVIGSKYQNTIPFVKERKGKVINYHTRISFFLFFWHKYWVVRNNHLVEYDKGKTANKHKKSEIKSVVEKKRRFYLTNIKGKNIQFWIMPYIDYKDKIVIQSHNKNNPFLFDLRKENIKTETVSFKAIHRHQKLKGWELKAFKILSKIEKYHASAVSVEIGVIGGRLDVLLVEKQKHTQKYIDKSALKLWREKYKKATFVENVSLSPFSRSILTLLNDNNLIYSKNECYSLPVKRKRFDINEVSNVIKALIQLHLNLDNLNNQYKLFGVAQIIADKLKQVVSFELSNSPIYGSSELGRIQEDLHRHIATYGISITSYEISDDWFSGNTTINCSEKEVIASIMKFSFAIIKILSEKENNNINTDNSLFSIIDMI